MSTIEDFFAELDDVWKGPRLELRLIGSAALMLQADFERPTRDADVLDTKLEHAAELLRIAGQSTRLAKQTGMYLQVVREAIPFLPREPLWHDAMLRLHTLDVYMLDITDVVVSKLKRFDARDVGDIQQMVDRGHVKPRRLVERFALAADVFAGDARGDDLRTYVERLNEVERDMLGVDETEFELPSWVR